MFRNGVHHSFGISKTYTELLEGFRALPGGIRINMSERGIFIRYSKGQILTSKFKTIEDAAKSFIDHMMYRDYYDGLVIPILKDASSRYDMTTNNHVVAKDSF
jgi:hypothetical protein